MNHNCLSWLAILAFYISALIPVHAQTNAPAWHQKLTLPAKILDQYQQGQERVAVIITLAPNARAKQKTDWNAPQSVATLRAANRADSTAVLQRLAAHEHRIRYQFDNHAGFSGELTAAALERLANDPRVAAIEPVMELEMHLNQGIPLMNALATRSTYTGTNLAIAICDTGIDYTHPRLGGGGFPNNKVIGGYDFGNGDANPMPVGQAHGTACAGIAAGNLGTVGDYIGGVAPGAKLYALKISPDNSGSATSDAMIAAWDWCVTHKNDDPDNPILVISTSFGGGRYFSACDSASPGMTTAANSAVAAGITVLASAGNDGYCDSMGWPACISSVISVGAMYDANFGNYTPCVNSASCANKIATGGCTSGYYVNDSTATNKVTAYSNSANFLDVFAPANQCYTTDMVGSPGYSSGDYATGFGGTSAACPYAAGAVAALQHAAKVLTGNYLTPAQVRSNLSATGVATTDTKVAITKPRVNLGNAIAAISGPLLDAASINLTGESCAPVNDAPDPGETVTVNLAIVNTGGAATANLIATLLVTNGITAPSAPANYGIIPSAGGVVTQSFSFTIAGACGATINPTLQLQDGTTNYGLRTYSLPLGALGPVTTNTYSSGGIAVSILDNATAEVPISITATGVVADVNVAIRLNHTYDADLTVELVHPDGTSIALATQRGGAGDNFGSGAASCAGTFTIFDDAAATAISAGSAPFTGTYRPDNLLSALNGKPLTGQWKLRVTDGFGADTGTVYCVQLEIASQTRACCEGAPPPASPTNLVVTAATDLDLSLSWADAATTETGFRIERSLTGSGSWTAIGTVTTNVTTFVDDCVTAGSNYFFRVFAFNGAGDSLPSNLATTNVPALPGNLIAFDTAAAPAYYDGWQTGDNAGSGFAPWELRTTSVNVNLNGFFRGGSAWNGGLGGRDIDICDSAFGLYANSGQSAVAFRAWDNGALKVGSALRWRMDTGWIETGGSAGVVLRTGNANANSSDYNTNSRFELVFIGGNTNYTIIDHAGQRDASVPYTSDGLEILFTLTGADTYTLAITTLASGATVQNSGTLQGASGATIDSLAVFNRFAGVGGQFDFFFNTPVLIGAPAQLVVTPADFDYGALTVGQTTATTFQVHNAGDLPLSGTATTAAPFAVTSGSPFTVLGGATNTVVVGFTPITSGVYSGAVTFVTDAGNTLSALAGGGLDVCDFALAPTNLIVSANGSTFTGTLLSASAPTCGWNVTSAALWISNLIPTNGNGTHFISYAVAANPAGARTGEVTAAGIVHTVIQTGCDFTLNTNLTTVAVDGVNFTNLFVSATGTACTWTASANVPWLTNLFPATGTGTAPVVFSVLPNAGASRTGEVTAAGIVHTVIQTGCEFTLNTNVTTVAVDGVSFTNLFVSTTGTACTWTASANVSWLTNLFPASGTGTAPVVFSVLPNATASRTGEVTAAGIVHTVIQTGCEFTLNTNLTTVAVDGVNFTNLFVSTTGTACTWTASANVPWIADLAPTNATGTGLLSFSVHANSGGSRTGVVMAAEIGHLVIQDGCEFSLSPTNDAFTAAGGLGGFTINPTGTACVWTITSPADWITIDSPTNGTGLTVVSYSVQTNTLTLPRTATITVAGASHVVEQAAAELPPFVQWQLDNFGCTNCPQAATNADPDGDGQDNWKEFLAGFNPTNSAAYFHITDITAEGWDIRVTWLAGGGRTNVVQSAALLTTNFTDISSVYIIPPGLPILTNHLHLGGATNDLAHFYRIRLEP